MNKFGLLTCRRHLECSLTRDHISPLISLHHKPAYINPTVFFFRPACCLVQETARGAVTRALDERPLRVSKKRLLSGLLALCVSVASERGPKVMPLHGIVLMTHPIL